MTYLPDSAASRLPSGAPPHPTLRTPKTKCRMFDDEVALIPSMKGMEAAEVISKVNEAEEEAVAEALAELEAGTPEDEKDRVSKVTASAVSPSTQRTSRKTCPAYCAKSNPRTAPCG